MVTCQIFLTMQVSRSFDYRPKCALMSRLITVAWISLVIHWFFRREASGQIDVHMSSQGGCCPRLSLQSLRLGAFITRVCWVHGVIPCNFRTRWMVTITKWGPFHFKRNNLSGCWFSRFLGSPSLLAGSGKGPGGWVWAAPGYPFHESIHGFSCLKGILKLFYSKGDKVCLLSGLENGSSIPEINAHNFTLSLGADHMGNRAIRSNLIQCSSVSWHSLTKAHFKVWWHLSTFPQKLWEKFCFGTGHTRARAVSWLIPFPSLLCRVGTNLWTLK